MHCVSDSDFPELSTTPSILALPSIDGVHNGLLSGERAVTVRIPPYFGIELGDVVWLHWVGSQYAGSLIRPQVITAPMIENGIVFEVENRYVQTNTYGSVQVGYLIDRHMGGSLASGCEIYSVAGLAPPSVDGVQIVHRDLPPLMAYGPEDGAATVRVPAYSPMHVDDVLIVCWHGQQTGAHFVERVIIESKDFGQDICVQVPERFLKNSMTRGQLVEVQYILVPIDGPEIASPLCRPFFIGAVPEAQKPPPTFDAATRLWPFDGRR